MQHNDKILFFDGHCGLCDRFVSFLFRRDKKHKLSYAPLQGNTALTVLPIPPSQLPDSVVFLIHGTVHIKSDAVIYSLSELGWGFQILRALLIIPKSVRNWFYDKLAQNRYRVFGKNELCRIPKKEEAKYFLP